MTEKRFALRAAAGVAGLVLMVSVATAPAFADKEGKPDRGRSEQAQENAPGQEDKDEAGNPQPGNGNGNPPEHAGGPAAQSPPPGHARPQPAPAKPAKPAKPVRPTKRAKPVHPVHPVHPGKPAHAPAKPDNPHAKAGKTTICHATGSATNPYVTITISDNALPAHARHQDGRDIIPAPAGGCPQTAPVTVTDGVVGERSAGRATPKTLAADVLGALVGRSAEQAPAGAVLGEVFEGGAAPASLPPLRDTLAETAAVTRRESGAPAPRAAAGAAGRLPFTGLEAALVALFGALLVLLGVLFRRLSVGRTA